MKRSNKNVNRGTVVLACIFCVCLGLLMVTYSEHAFLMAAQGQGSWLVGTTGEQTIEQLNEVVRRTDKQDQLLKGNVLIAVSTTSLNIRDRYFAIGMTWGRTSSLLLPSTTRVDVEYYSDKIVGGFQRREDINIVSGDTNYGLERMTDLIKTLAKKTKANAYDWVLISHDHVYIDVEQLLSFLSNSSTPDSSRFILYGVPITLPGVKGRVLRYIEKGAGYLIPSSLLLKMAEQMEYCVTLPTVKKNKAYLLPLCARAILNVTCRTLPVYQSAPSDFPAVANGTIKVHHGPVSEGSAGNTAPVIYNHINSKTDMIQLHSILVQRSKLPRRQEFMNTAATTTVSLTRHESTTNSSIPPWQNPFIFPETFLFQEITLENQNNSFDKTLFAKLQNSVQDEIYTKSKTSDWLDTTTHINLENDSNKFQIAVRKCMNCANASSSLDESWYNVVQHPWRVITAKVNNNTGEIQSIIQSAIGLSGTKCNSFDILVPFKGKCDRLILLLLSTFQSMESINTFRSSQTKITVRVLVTAHPDDEWILSNNYTRDITSAFESNQTQIKIAVNSSKALIIGNMEVIAIPCNYYENGETTGMFQRTSSINTLLDHSCRSKNCIVSIVDSDMTLSPSFFTNAMYFVYPNVTMYFPIVYSEYNPKTVKLVEEERIKNPMAQATIDSYKMDHVGRYRPTGYGMWAMSGFDAAGFRLDASFKGWGGEDLAFYLLVSRSLHAIRMNEPGLVHKWHYKSCELGSFVQTLNKKASCQQTVAFQEGSPYGLYLLDLKRKKKTRAVVNSTVIVEVNCECNQQTFL